MRPRLASCDAPTIQGDRSPVTLRRVRHTLWTLLTSLVALAVLAGCSGDVKSDGGTEPIAVQPAEVERDGGTETIGIRSADVAFELPEGWVRLDPAEALEAATDDGLMAELVERHGPDTERMGPVYYFILFARIPPRSESEVLASDKGVENGFLSQMEGKVLSQDELPSVAELEQRYQSDALEPADVLLAEIDTAVGPAVLAAWSRRGTTPVVHGAQLTLDTGTELVEISILTGDLAKSEQIASDIADSFQRIP
jgi:hypothetical protein